MLSESEIIALKLEIAEAFRAQLRIEERNARRVLDEMESEKGRLDLIETEPETYKNFEAHTRVELEKRGYELALSAAIGHAIVFGFGLIQPYLSRP